jgi:hypothetical protein
LQLLVIKPMGPAYHTQTLAARSTPNRFD